MLTRRAVLAGLAATACAPKSGPLTQLPSTPVALGWRLAPGDLFSLLARVERQTASETTLRSEIWAYRVLEVDRGIARIEAHVTGLGAGLHTDEGTEARAVPPSSPTELALARDGRLHGASDPDLMASLPHYALAVALPSAPVQIHDEWDDPLASLCATLLPAALEPVGTGVTALRALSLTDGRAYAELQTLGEVRSLGPRLDIAGTARWDLLAGRLAERTVTIRASGLGGGEADPGVLSVTLSAPPR